MWRSKHIAGIVAALVATTSMVEAQSAKGFLFREPRVTVTVHGGVALPSAGSDLFDFTTDELTLGRNDFNAANFGADLAVRLSPRWDLAFGFTQAGSRERSEYRDWVDNNDQPIEQVTKFSRVPVVASVRYHPLPRGRQVGTLAWIPAAFDPWIGAGVGVMRYSFVQHGDFIDFEDPDNPVVFTDHFESKGWANVGQLSAGGGWNLSPRTQLTLELRYIRASDELDGDFVGFDRLDLSGLATSLGVTLRL